VERNMQRKVMIIGLDGATWDVLRPWVAEGTLPTLGRLMREGTHGNLTTSIPPVSASAWVSFATGKNPGKHGIVDFVFPKENGYQVLVSNVSYRASKAVWNIINEAGGKVGIVSVPMTYPPEHVDGFVISSFMAPSQESRYTYPDDLKDELREMVGEFPLIMFEGHRAGRSDLFIEDMRSFDIKRAKAVRYLAENKEWDFFCFVFETIDTLQHELWHLMDPLHPRHDPAKAVEVKDAIKGFYQDIDKALGEIIEAAGEDTLVMIMSDHGFGAFHRFFHVNNWLLELGLMKLKRTPLSLFKHALFRLGYTPMKVLRIVSALKLSNLRKRVKRGRGRGLLRKLFLSFEDVDWSRTQAFVVGNFGQLYINIIGKRLQGCVQPGNEYEALRDRIVREALALIDPDTGEHVIKYAYKREEIYSGDRLGKMPDIILHTDRSRYVSFGHADFGSNRVIEPSYGQTGHHNMTGILVLHGEGVDQTKVVEGAHIIDVAPTTLYAMGIPIPDDMDGRVLEEVFTSEYRALHQPTYTDSSSVRERESEDYQSEDEEKVMERLRGLGYIA